MTIQTKNNNKIVARLFPEVDFHALAEAIMLLFTAASEKHTGDCYEIHHHAAEFLKSKGVEAKVVVGDAAWRVDGKHGGAVISHVANPNIDISNMAINGYAAQWFHCWLQLNEHWFLDLSTFQFTDKMRILDAQDGTYTPVSWRPDFLAFNKAQIVPLNKVASAFKEGVFFYQACSKKKAMIAAAVEAEAEHEDFTAEIRAIYDQLVAGDNVKVIGVNTQ